jgi:hypothetical protein
MVRHARRFLLSCSLAAAALLVTPAAAFACGGLVAPGHAEVLQKATTLAAWHAGFEHYVTGFQFAGGADRFGYIIPLPGVPTKIQKAGEWTLERLEREINPPAFAEGDVGFPVALRASPVQVITRTRVDALDIVVVKGGGADVATWAEENGFDLTPDTPRVLSRYSDAGAIFALAKFDALAATKKGLTEGQGTVIHFTIPTTGPWIPLNILALGKAPAEIVNADLFILTDRRPELDPAALGAPGVEVRTSEAASKQLLADLRSDRGMGWLPSSGMWFTAITMNTPAAAIQADLAIDAGGPPAHDLPSPSEWRWLLPLVVLAAGMIVVAGAVAGRSRLRPQLP